MGRNDISSVVSFLFLRFKQQISIDKFAFLLPATVFMFFQVLFVGLFAQETEDTQKGGKQEVVTYKVRVNYPPKSQRLYKMTEVTEVERMYSDSITAKYKREVEYNMTISQPDPEKNGFVDLAISIDSIKYKFTDGDAVFEFNSQSDSMAFVSLKDLDYITVPMGHDFVMTYSPYGEVAKISGEGIQWLRDYLAKNSEGYFDQVTSFIWVDGASDRRLKYLTDVKKIKLPEQRMAKDSIWLSPLNFLIDYKEYQGTVKAKISNYNVGAYTLEVRADSLAPVPGDYYLYSVKKLGNVEKCTGGGIMLYNIDKLGVISKLETDFTISIEAKVRFEPIYEKVHQRAVWELLGMYRL